MASDEDRDPDSGAIWRTEILQARAAKTEAELADRRREDADPLGKLHAARVEIVEQRRRVAMAEAEVARLRAAAATALKMADDAQFATPGEMAVALSAIVLTLRDGR